MIWLWIESNPFPNDELDTLNLKSEILWTVLDDDKEVKETNKTNNFQDPNPLCYVVY